MKKIISGIIALLVVNIALGQTQNYTTEFFWDFDNLDGWTNTDPEEFYLTDSTLYFASRKGDIQHLYYPILIEGKQFRVRTRFKMTDHSANCFVNIGLTDTIYDMHDSNSLFENSILMRPSNTAGSSYGEYHMSGYWRDIGGGTHAISEGDDWLAGYDGFKNLTENAWYIGEIVVSDDTWTMSLYDDTNTQIYTASNSCESLLGEFNYFYIGNPTDYNFEYLYGEIDWVEVALLEPSWGPIAYYPFNGDASDESGNGNDGLATGAILTTDRFGNPDQAYLFDGVDDKITLPGIKSLAIPSAGSPFSISFWMKPAAMSGFTYLYDEYETGSGGIRIFLADDDLGVRVNTSAITDAYQIYETVVSGEYSHVLVTYDGATLEVWHNGVSVGQWGVAIFQPANKNDITFGLNSESFGGNAFNGVIDDIIVHQRQVFSAEIDSLYRVGGWPLPSVRPTTFHVPGDWPSIQTAIDSSIDGDTVLVHPGTYVENINFNGKNIVLGSLYLTTGDTSYISQTIVDGNQDGTVVIFHNDEDSTALLTGFTIQNGLGGSNISGFNDTYGGGIFCRYADPRLSHLIIQNNSAYYGGGFWLSSSNSHVDNLIIRNNSAGGIGGGGHIYEGDPQLNHLTVTGNSANYGGGLEIDSDLTLSNSIIQNNTGSGSGLRIGFSAPTITNILVSNNSGSKNYGAVWLQAEANPIIQFSSIVNNTGSGISSFPLSEGTGANAQLKNSIVWGNTDSSIVISSGAVATSTSCLEGGWSGTGNIEFNPLFVDAAEQDFHLTDFSPCIGAGSTTDTPDSDLDGNNRPVPVGTNPDMGAYESILGTPIHNSFIHVATDGDDAGVGLQSAPLATIQTAIDYSEEGDTVLVNPGTYVENLNFEHKNIVLGSMYLTTGDTSYISQTIIDGNRSGSAVVFGPGVYSSCEFTGFSIINGGWNSGDQAYGGGIKCLYAEPTIHHLILRDNSAYAGGGLYISRSKANIHNLTLIDNASYRGVLEIQSQTAQLTLEDIYVSGALPYMLNSENTTGGTGVLVQSDTLTLSRMTVENCSNVGISSTAELTIINSLLNNNGYAGVQTYSNGNTKIINSTITGNSHGVTCANDGGSMELINTIIWNNTRPFSLNGSYRPVSLRIEYCDIQGGREGIETTGDVSIDWGKDNINKNPLFVDLDTEDFHLSDQSPCIDRGNSMGAPATDIEGNSRPSPTGTNPDMGAYENQLSYPDTTYITGATITQDTLWTRARSPYLISGDVVIENYATLTIEPGVEVLFEPVRDDQVAGWDTTRSEIVISNGQLHARGTSENKIVFRSREPSPGRTDWSMIRWNSGEKDTIDHCVFEDGGQLHPFRVVDITNCTFRNGAYPYLASGPGEMTISNNYFGSGIWDIGTDPHIATIENNTVAAGDIGIANNAIAIVRFNTMLDTNSSVIINSSYSVDIQVYNNNIHGFRNDSPFPINAKYNYWGSATTDEMSDSPKLHDISRIYDHFDVDTLGIVNYSLWLDAPWPEGEPASYKPRITVIEDIPDDQGGWAKVRFTKSHFDEGESASYTISRKDGAEWVSLHAIDGTGFSEYVTEVRTLMDSSASQSGLTRFRVLAVTEMGNFQSLPASGYSVDNIAPAIPGGLYATASGPKIKLDWRPPTEADFKIFRVYRHTQRDFELADSLMISETIDNFYTDNRDEVGRWFYRISAVDIHDNESPGSAAIRGVVLSMFEEQLPEEYTLEKNYPNPFNPSTTIRYGLPEDARVTLIIYDINGREVKTIADASQAAGWYTLQWNGFARDGSPVGTGVYFARIQTGKYSEVIKMVYLR